MTLIDLFNKKIEDTFTITQYKLWSKWLQSHIERIEYGYLGERFDWIKIGGKVYFKTSYGVEEAIVKDVIVTNNLVGFKTDRGNVWYFEVRKTKKQAEKTDYKF